MSLRADRGNEAPAPKLRHFTPASIEFICDRFRRIEQPVGIDE
jgi:hypothetical protein